MQRARIVMLLLLSFLDGFWLPFRLAERCWLRYSWHARLPGGHNEGHHRKG